MDIVKKDIFSPRRESPSNRFSIEQAFQGAEGVFLLTNANSVFFSPTRPPRGFYRLLPTREAYTFNEGALSRQLAFSEDPRAVTLHFVYGVAGEMVCNGQKSAYTCLPPVEINRLTRAIRAQKIPLYALPDDRKVLIAAAVPPSFPRGEGAVVVTTPQYGPDDDYAAFWFSPDGKNHAPLQVAPHKLPPTLTPEHRDALVLKLENGPVLRALSILNGNRVYIEDTETRPVPPPVYRDWIAQGLIPGIPPQPTPLIVPEMK